MDYSVFRLTKKRSYYYFKHVPMVVDLNISRTNKLDHVKQMTYVMHNVNPKRFYCRKSGKNI